MRVVHVIARIGDASAGPSYSVPRLASALREHSVAARVFTVDDGRVPPNTEPDAPVRRFAADPPRVLVGSRALRIALRTGCIVGDVDIVHDHGLWLPPNHYAALAVRGTPVPLIVAPRGTLAPWALARSRGRKLLVRYWWQDRMLRNARCFHATADSEADDIRRLGFRQPIAIVPNGVDLPAPVALPTGASNARPATVLFLARLHPSKGIAALLRAWAAVAAEFPHWQLRIAGPDNDGHGKAMQALCRELQAPRVDFPGPLFGADKARAFANASLYVLPSHTENFGMTIAEALAAGVPVIASKGSPWSALPRVGAGWWTDSSPAPLAAVLREALALSSSQLQQMGANGRQWIRATYDWHALAGRMAAVYTWLGGRGEPPDCVRFE